MYHEKLSEQYHRNIMEFYLIPEVGMNPVFQQQKCQGGNLLTFHIHFFHMVEGNLRITYI